MESEWENQSETAGNERDSAAAQNIYLAYTTIHEYSTVYSRVIYIHEYALHIDDNVELTNKHIQDGGKTNSAGETNDRWIGRLNDPLTLMLLCGIIRFGMRTISGLSD